MGKEDRQKRRNQAGDDEDDDDYDDGFVRRELDTVSPAAETIEGNWKLYIETKFCQYKK